MRVIVQLVSSAGTGFTYSTVKNRKNTAEKLVRQKYDPIVRKHVAFVEKR